MSDPLPPPVPWECLTCARKCDLVVDDFCPTCGAELPEPRTRPQPECGESMPLTPAERAVAADLLGKAADQFGRHGCNE